MMGFGKKSSNLLLAAATIAVIWWLVSHPQSRWVAAGIGFVVVFALVALIAFFTPGSRS